MSNDKLPLSDALKRLAVNEEKFEGIVNGAEGHEEELGGKKTPSLRTIFANLTDAAFMSECVQRACACAKHWALQANKIATEDAVIATGSTEARTLPDRFADVVNVKDFGAVGDGVTDDTAAIQAALDASYNMVVFPKGVYVISNDVYIPEHITVDGQNSTVIISGSGKFCISGSVSDSGIAIADTVLQQSGSLTTQTSHNAVVDDDFIIQSTVNAISTDAGDWQLGLPTGAYHASYFTEPFRVSSVVSDTALEFFPRTVFPDYPAGSLIKKVSFNKNSVIENFIIDSSEYDGTAIYVNWASDALVRNITIKKGSQTGASVVFKNSLKCRAENVSTIREYPLPKIDSGAGTEHHLWNAYKFIGSWSCEFIACYDEYGSQSFDVTYLDYGNPSMFCAVRGCTSYAPRWHGITTHSGSYGIIVENNRIVKAKSGISLRSRACICTGNYIDCTFDNSTEKGTGIGLLDGFYVDSLISNNTISGAYTGIRVMRSNSLGLGFVTINTSILGNIIRNCSYGIYTDGNYPNETSESSGLVINSNDISGIKFNGIHISDYVNNAVISNNKIEADNSCIYVAVNSKKPTIINNYCITPLASSGGITVSPTYDSNIVLNFFEGQGTAFKNGAVKATSLLGNVILGQYSGNIEWDISNVSSGVVADGNASFVICGKGINPAVLYLGDFSNYDKGAIVYSNEKNTLYLKSNGTFVLGVTPAQFAPYNDNTTSLGAYSKRWSQVYAASGSINTSDANEKQDVQNYPDEVLDAWGEVKFRQFLFKDAVTAKGDAARIHAGVIAQQVVDAFARHNLDATRYGLLCYDEWSDEYETVEVVDVPAVLDADGNEVTPAQTHTERRLVTAAGDRYGIRYSEALCMEAAYQRRRADKLEQRIANIEEMLK